MGYTFSREGAEHARGFGAAIAVGIGVGTALALLFGSMVRRIDALAVATG